MSSLSTLSLEGRLVVVLLLVLVELVDLGVVVLRDLAQVSDLPEEALLFQLEALKVRVPAVGLGDEVEDLRLEPRVVLRDLLEFLQLLDVEGLLLLEAELELRALGGELEVLLEEALVLRLERLALLAQVLHLLADLLVLLRADALLDALEFLVEPSDLLLERLDLLLVLLAQVGALVAELDLHQLPEALLAQFLGLLALLHEQLLVLVLLLLQHLVEDLELLAARELGLELRVEPADLVLELLVLLLVVLPHVLQLSDALVQILVQHLVLRLQPVILAPRLADLQVVLIKPLLKLPNLAAFDAVDLVVHHLVLRLLVRRLRSRQEWGENEGV